MGLPENAILSKASFLLPGPATPYHLEMQGFKA